ncbi:MAG: protein NosL [Candidatus Lambdaproteobacteria bacterium]|nr:protein NosL [Candidatus Lambdaproteobacteria bacterium]
MTTGGRGDRLRGETRAGRCRRSRALGPALRQGLPLALLLAALAAPGAGCFRSGAERGPAQVHWDRDQDPECGMMISDRRFAAQAVSPEGRGHTFGDIGCLVLWLERQRWNGEARVWVRDRLADRWIEAERARWRGGEQTPSGFGFGASADPAYGALSFAEVRRTILHRRAAGASPGGMAAPPSPY